MDRQLTLFKFEVGIQEMKQADDGRYDLVRRKVCEVEDSSLTRTKIRALIKAEGVDCKPGADVYAVKTGKVVYHFTTEALLSVAESREELPLD